MAEAEADHGRGGENERLAAGGEGGADLEDRLRRCERALARLRAEAERDLAAAIEAALAPPPDPQLLERLSRAEAAREAERRARREAERRAETAERTAAEAANSAEAEAQAAAEARAQQDAALARAAAAEADCAEARRALDAVLASTAWRATAPLRRTLDALRRRP
jgi:hypothetical protein